MTTTAMQYASNLVPAIAKTQFLAAAGFAPKNPPRRAPLWRIVDDHQG